MLFSGLIALAATSAMCAQRQLSVIPVTKADQTVLVPATLGILVNENDDASLPLAVGYAKLRGVPLQNIIVLNLPLTNDVAKAVMRKAVADLRSAGAYGRLKAFALAFPKPFRVGGAQSITSAVSDGVSDMSWIGACNVTAENPDYGAAPGANLNAKSAMMLIGGASYADSAKLFARGAASDNTDPPGQAYLVTTTDRARSGPREEAMMNAKRSLSSEFGVTEQANDNLTGRNDVMAFETGLARIEGLRTLKFRPGAYADHLTSFGGVLFGPNPQTPITDFIEAGATGAYGTVREPCNLAAKFPAPDKMLANYLHGDSLLEAYWKSVEMTTEGIFVGEPLARPFPLVAAISDGRVVALKANRHTRFLLTTLQSPFAAADWMSRLSLAKDTTVSIFQVESGVPVFLGEVRIPAMVESGDDLGQVTLRAANGSPTPILGVMK